MTLKSALIRGTAVAFILATILPSAEAQTFSPEQKKDFSELFKLAPHPSLRVGAQFNELSTLLNIQNKRIAVPANPEAFKARIAHSPMIEAFKKKETPQLGTILIWNANALDLAAIDHTLPGTGSNGHEQFGPHRTSRALGIVHLAIFEAVNTIHGSYESYHGIRAMMPTELAATLPGFALSETSPNNTTTDTAIVEAAHDTMVALYPKKRDIIDFMENTSLQSLGNGTDPAQMDEAHRRGYYIGKAAAKLVLADRGYDAIATGNTSTSTFNDGSSEPEPSSTDARYASDGPDRWHPDPIHPLGLTALGGNWMHVKPFTLSSASAARPMAEPAKTSARFISAYKDVKLLGGDPTPAQQAPRHTTNTNRSEAQTIVGNFWAYDGTALLCAPPRLYNEIATSIALKEKPIKHVAEMARFLALVNIAMADAGISAWDAKYAFRLGRPVTFIRAFSVDSSSAGSKDSQWTPLGAPVSNGTIDARNLTPPFPSYPSGHAVFGGAVFEMFRLFWATNGTDEKFSFMSDEYNGKNYAPGGDTPRPAVTKTFATFKDAEDENARSRIYLGIHWQFDAKVGVTQGHEVAMHVFNNAFQPIVGE